MGVKEPQPGNKPAYRERAELIAATPDWSLVGRISLDDGDQGGSGRLQWDVGSDNSELDFHGAMGRGAWHLQIGPEAVVLRESNGAEQTAAEVNALIQDRMGWPIPVDALQWWVRGLAAPGAIEKEEIDHEGLLISLAQFGWSVDFNRYDLVAGVALPVKLNAKRDNYRVKLVVSRWRMDVNHVPGN